MSLNIKLSALVVGVTLASLGFSTASDAAIVTVPTDLAPGSQYRLVFVTSTTRDATSTNISDYNTFVDNTAKATGSLLNNVNTTWKAIGSTASVNAIDNTNTPTSVTGIPIYLVDGTRIADNYADLWDGTIASGIIWTEKDTPLYDTGQGFVWSGTWYDGSNNGGFLGDNGVTKGFADGSVLGVAWIAESGGDPGDVWAMYGMSDVLTVPQPQQSVPEPTSILGFITFGGYLLGSASGSQKGRVKIKQQ